jgi:ketosteroid isomerase-like protein
MRGWMQRLAEEGFATLDRGDIEAFLELVDPAVEFNSLIAEAEGRTYRGHAGVRAWWRDVAQALGTLRFERERIEAHGDTAVVRLRIVGTVDGVEVPQTMWQALHGRAGRLAWWSVYRSEAEARAALAERVRAAG